MFWALALCQRKANVLSISPSLLWQRAKARKVSLFTLFSTQMFTLNYLLYSLLLMQHHSFIRNLPPLFIWLIYWLTDSLTVWLADGQMDGQMDWLTDKKSHFYLHIDFKPTWTMTQFLFIYWIFTKIKIQFLDWLIDWQTEGLTGWLTDWLTD